MDYKFLISLNISKKTNQIMISSLVNTKIAKLSVYIHTRYFCLERKYVCIHFVRAIFLWFVLFLYQRNQEYTGSAKRTHNGRRTVQEVQLER